MKATIRSVCPFCGSPRDPQAPDFRCPSCGLDNAFVACFSDGKAMEAWNAGLQQAAGALAENLSQGDLTLRSQVLGYLYPARQQLFLIRQDGTFQVEDHVVSFSACDRQYALLYADGSAACHSSDQPDSRLQKLDFQNLRSILACPQCIYGVTDRGTVAASGTALPEVLGWTGIRRLYSAGYLVLGLTRSGDLKIAGEMVPDSLLEAVNSLHDIQAVSLSGNCIAALDREGSVTILDTKSNQSRQKAESWKDLKDIQTDSAYVIGLTADGKLQLAGSCPPILDHGRSGAAHWENLACICCTSGGFAGLDRSGHLLTTDRGYPEDVPRIWQEKIRPLLFRKES